MALIAQVTILKMLVHQKPVLFSFIHCIPFSLLLSEDGVINFAKKHCPRHLSNHRDPLSAISESHVSTCLTGFTPYLHLLAPVVLVSAVGCMSRAALLAVD